MAPEDPVMSRGFVLFKNMRSSHCHVRQIAVLYPVLVIIWPKSDKLIGYKYSKIKKMMGDSVSRIIDTNTVNIQQSNFAHLHLLETPYNILKNPH